MKPINETALDGSAAPRMKSLLDALDSALRVGRDRHRRLVVGLQGDRDGTLGQHTLARERERADRIRDRCRVGSTCTVISLPASVGPPGSWSPGASAVGVVTRDSRRARRRPHADADGTNHTDPGERQRRGFARGAGGARAPVRTSRRPDRSSRARFDWNGVGVLAQGHTDRVSKPVFAPEALMSSSSLRIRASARAASDLTVPGRRAEDGRDLGFGEVLVVPEHHDGLLAFAATRRSHRAAARALRVLRTRNTELLVLSRVDALDRRRGACRG